MADATSAAFDIPSYEHVYIDGQWRGVDGSAVQPVVAPHDEREVATAPSGSAADIDAAVGAARRAFDAGPWPRLPLAERLAVLGRLADGYEARLPRMAATITAEMGTPIRQSLGRQAAGGLGTLRATIAHAAAYGWDDRRPTGQGGQALIKRRPAGVVGAIAPFNFPQMLIMSKLAPALASGCTVVVKPAPETPLDALLLAEIVDEAGLPAGVVNVVPASSDVSRGLVTHRGVDKIAFTGSTEAGRKIAAACGQDMRRCTLELGGKSAAIVLDDADPSWVALGLQHASLTNSGQGCVAQTRILVPRVRRDMFIEAIVAMTEGLVVGDPTSEQTDVGPMVSPRQQERVRAYIQLGIDEGATVAIGGLGMPDDLDRGWYVRPTVFVDATNDMRVAREEIFGPVLCIIDYDTVDEAIRIAEDSEFGLGGSVWTNDLEAGLAVADRVRVGAFGVNTFAVDFDCPFGGFKASGIGREFGPEALHEYTEAQTIYLPRKAAA